MKRKIKHLILCVLCMLCSLPHLSAEQYSVPLLQEASGNVFVEARVNGVPVRFAFDTGCSMLLLNKTIFRQLEQNGSISRDMLSKPSTSEMANGMSHMVRMFALESLEIGECTIPGIYVQYGPNDADDATPLLGQAFLQLLRWYKIEDGILTFEPLPDATIRAYTSVSVIEEDTSRTDEVIALLEPLTLQHSLTPSMQLTLAYAYGRRQRFDEAWDIMQAYMNNPHYITTPQIRKDALIIRANMAGTLIDQERYPEAREVLSEVRRDATQLSDEEQQPLVREVLYLYAFMALSDEDPIEAERTVTEYVNYLLRPYRIQATDLSRYTISDLEDTRAASLLFYLGELLKAKGRTADGVIWQARATNIGYVSQ